LGKFGDDGDGGDGGDAAAIGTADFEASLEV
jgi:hypothetical protein